MQFKFLKNKEKTHKNNKEKSRGRSMVEMLGVLAIIGVLSIGGIQGYTIAMRRYRANELSNLIVKYAFLAYDNFQRQMLDDPEKYWSDQVDRNGNKGNFFPLNYDKEFLPFENTGLGGTPDELKELWIEGFYFDKMNNNPSVFVGLHFKNKSKQLCLQIKNNFSGYGFSDSADGTYNDDYDSDSIDTDSVACQYFSVVIPIEGMIGFK